MAAAVRRRADRVGGVILVDDGSSACADTAGVDAAGEKEVDAVEATAAVRGRLLPGDGGQCCMLGMASGDI